ncbi:MAG: hypothetical protein ABSA76_16195 [Bacteroidales bacterium]
MKRSILILLITVAFTITGYSQDYKTALGLRAGLPYGVTLRHFINKDNALEGILASRWSGLVITGLYENESWLGKYPALNWYWGFGAHAGFWDQGTNPNVNSTYVGAVIGADAILGIEYTFDEFPINLSLDLLPSLNLIGSTGWGGINGALSIRYVF